MTTVIDARRLGKRGAASRAPAAGTRVLARRLVDQSGVGRSMASTMSVDHPPRRVEPQPQLLFDRRQERLSTADLGHTGHSVTIFARPGQLEVVRPFKAHPVDDHPADTRFQH